MPPKGNSTQRENNDAAGGALAGRIRVGHGYDLHRLAPLKIPGGAAPAQGTRPFVLAGVRLDHDKGPVGHSDGDALYHAVTDALLGALALPDIGQLFPDTDPRHEGRDSAEFLSEAVRLVRSTGWAPVNLDCTVILERPRLSPHKEAMRANIARLTGLAIECVNVKGKTHEGVDAVGEGRAIEVHVAALLERVSDPR